MHRTMIPRLKVARDSGMHSFQKVIIVQHSTHVDVMDGWAKSRTWMRRRRLRTSSREFLPALAHCKASKMESHDYAGTNRSGGGGGGTKGPAILDKRNTEQQCPHCDRASSRCDTLTS